MARGLGVRIAALGPGRFTQFWRGALAGTRSVG